MLTLNQSYNHEGNLVAWGVIGEGYPLILMHGTPFSSQVWRRIAPWLARQWKVYFFDMIGYGQSEMKTGQIVSLEMQNQLLTGLIKEWGLKLPDVLCHDFGGATALRGYYLNGLRYRNLTLLDPVALAPWGSPFVAHVRRFEEAFAGLPDYAHEALLQAYLSGAAHTPLSEETSKIYIQPWLGEVGKPAFYRQIAQMDQKYTDEIEGQYGPMECNTTLLWGEMDEWIPIERGQKLAGLLSDSKLISVPNAGHLMQEDAPEAIIAAMLANL